MSLQEAIRLLGREQEEPLIGADESNSYKKSRLLGREQEQPLIGADESNSYRKTSLARVSLTKPGSSKYSTAVQNPK